MGDERHSDYLQSRRTILGIPGAAQPFRFNGPTYDAHVDRVRLTGQVERIFTLMRDGTFRTLPEIAAATKDPEASISAQLRHLRKERFGGHTIEKRRRGADTSGLWEYRLIVSQLVSQSRRQSMEQTPPHDAKEPRVDSASDERVVNNVMRHEYRVLSDAEKAAMKDFKDKGLAFVEACDALGSSRELSIAKTKTEEAVMWAVKHLTK